MWSRRSYLFQIGKRQIVEFLVVTIAGEVRSEPATREAEIQIRWRSLNRLAQQFDCSLLVCLSDENIDHFLDRSGHELMTFRESCAVNL